MRVPLRALAALVLALAPATPVSGDELVDEDYRFRIESPGKEWQLLHEDQARGLCPDAIAGLFRPGLFMVVIAEHAPGCELRAMGRTIFESMTGEMEDPVEEGEAELSFQGRAAVRYQFSGSVDEQRFRYQVTLFTNGEYIYQVNCWGLPEVFDRECRALAPVHEAFVLLDGEPTGRRAALATDDTHGVGWLVRDGVFRSAPYRLRVEAPAPWRVVAGSELEDMNADAEVGLLCEIPDLYLVLIPERVPPELAGEYAGGLRDAFAQGAQASGDPREARIDGSAFQLQPYSIEEQPQFTFLHGVLAREGVCYQALVWYLSSAHEKAGELLASAFGSIRFLDEREQAALARELATLPDPENVVAASFSLRDGVYRDYEAEFIWRKPAGAWRATVGQDARSVWGDYARLGLEEPALGVLGVVFTWEAEVGLREEHDGYVQELVGEPGEDVEPKEIEIGGVEALEVQLVSGTGVDASGYRVVSAQASGSHHTLLFLGPAGNVQAASREIDAACRTFVLGVQPPVPGIQDGVYRDEKVGFELASPAEGWVANQELVPGTAAELGGSCGWSDRKGREVFAIAQCMYGAGKDEATIEGLILGAIAEKLGARAEEGEDLLEGLPCRRKTFRSLLSKTEVLVTRRANTLYLLGVTSRLGSPTLEEAKQLFSFLP